GPDYSHLAPGPLAIADARGTTRVGDVAAGTFFRSDGRGAAAIAAAFVPGPHRTGRPADCAVFTGRPFHRLDPRVCHDADLMRPWRRGPNGAENTPCIARWWKHACPGWRWPRRWCWSFASWESSVAPGGGPRLLSSFTPMRPALCRA